MKSFLIYREEKLDALIDTIFYDNAQHQNLQYISFLERV